MRILVIRGRNLASLAGDFEMRLDALPLSEAGLFAITGRTGSGKSTTLDALCLALFDRMPRLPQRRGVDVGRADDAPQVRLKDNDVRSILRRGTGEGFAEVDFRGVDGRRYRARWTVRRARQRSNGRFQFQTMALRDLENGTDLSGTKTEVLDAIQNRLGLTFDQFRRSVLLAQGDFAAFLRADAGERAELLERITGTAVYGEISRASHLRVGEEKKKLELLRQRLGDQCPLDDEARGVLETELASARRALDEQRRAEQTLQQAQHWYLTLDKLTAERDQAGEQLSRALSEREASEPRRREFERILALQPLRLPLTALDRAAEALGLSRSGLERSIAEEGARRLDAERAATVAVTDEAALAAARTAVEDGAPPLRIARSLDTRILGAREHVGRAEADREAARKTLEDAAVEEDRLNTRSARATETLANAEDWLAAHAGVEPLAAHWDAWSRELERFAGARVALDKAGSAIEAANRVGSELIERRQTQEALIARTGVERKRLSAERAALETRTDAVDLEGLAARRERGLARQREVERWRILASKARETRARLVSTKEALEAEKARRTHGDARLREIEVELIPLAASLAEAEEGYRRLLLASAADVETLRSRLENGKPCPVCGAEAHPWGNRASSVVEDLTKEQADGVAGFKRRFDDLSVAKARLGAETEQAARRGEELGTELDTLQSLIGRTLESWNACASDELRPADPFEDGSAERQEAEIEAVADTLREIAANEATARLLFADIKAKTAEIERIDTRFEAAKKQLADLDGEIRTAADVRNRAEMERDRAAETIDKVTELFTVPLAGIEDWRSRLPESPETFADDCRREVEAWQGWTKKRDEAQQTGLCLAPRLAEARMRRNTAEQELARRSSAREQQVEALAALERERAGMLDGRSADDVEFELNAAAAQAQQKQEQSRGDLAGAREALTAAQGVLATRRKSLHECEAAAAQAQQALDVRLTENGVSLDELREALKRDQDWVERERLVFQSLQDACDRSQELLRERERRLSEHRSAEPPELHRETVWERLPLAAESLKIVQEHWGHLHGRLGEDDRRRRASREIRAELERQQAAWELWESMNQLIGSASGGKFRNFAQGLTLDLLVAHANQYLRDLARRYELQRVPDAEMEIQVVDREMGDEVRSIHSLSGGESFLVSLALALGLASLASDRVEVESLFIDEGFGALDADSLDLAIASLDALYSLGRQVGVISHVGTLVERIGVKVQVTKQGGGRSRLDVVAD